MVHNVSTQSAVKGTSSQLFKSKALPSILSPVSLNRSRHRRLLSLNKTLLNLKIARSWFDWDTLLIEGIPNVRSAITIRIETVIIPGLPFPIEYFNAQQCRTFITFKTPCSSNFELLKKLHSMKLISYDESIAAMLEYIKEQGK